MTNRISKASAIHIAREYGDGGSAIAYDGNRPIAYFDTRDDEGAAAIDYGERHVLTIVDYASGERVS